MYMCYTFYYRETVNVRYTGLINNTPTGLKPVGDGLFELTRELKAEILLHLYYSLLF